MLVEQSLTGKSILVIEDDFIDELALAYEFQFGGERPRGPYNVHDQTVAMLKGSDVGAAILDGHLDYEKVEEIITALTELGIPFVISDSGFPMPGNGMSQLSGELTVLAHQLFGAPTFH